jgi:hypothetical protein
MFNYDQGKLPTTSLSQKSNSSITMLSVENSTVQYRLLPVDKNIIRARFENLADKFDANWQKYSIDIMQFARELY